MLYLPGNQGIRLSLRVSAFAISLVAFLWWQVQSDTRPPAHRAYSWVAAVMGLLGRHAVQPVHDVAQSAASRT